MESCLENPSLDSPISMTFTDIVILPSKGFNLLCKARRYGRWWLLKGLKKEFRDQTLYQTLLRKEFDITISLQHHNIVSASSLEWVENLGLCIVMEWIDGITLDKWVKMQDDACRTRSSVCKKQKRKVMNHILLQIIESVHYIHSAQIVHRDLKPENIMITRNGQHVKLIDFGLADRDSYTILKQPAGTEGFVSPEQKTSSETDLRNDIFSLGCLIQYMFPDEKYEAIVKQCKADICKRCNDANDLKQELLLLNESSCKRSFMQLFYLLTVILDCAILYLFLKHLVNNS